MATFKELREKVKESDKKLSPKPTDNNPKNEPKPLSKHIFEPEESRYLINLIARSDFKGSDVQIVYNIAIKLQDIIKESLKETNEDYRSIHR